MKLQLNKLIFSAIFMSIIFMATSCTNNFSISNPDVKKLTQKAHQLLEEGKYEAAIGRLESINDLDPDFAENHYNLGIAYYRNEQPEKALDSLEKAVNLNKNLVDAYYTTAVIYEDLALKKIKQLDEIKDDQEKSINLTFEIIDDYKNSKNSFISYLKQSSTEEKQNIMEKIKEINAEIQTYEEQAESVSKK